MGWWRVSADILAGSRFVVSALAETTASLFALHRASAAHPGERAWLDEHLPAYRQRLAADPITALLIRSARGYRWTANFLTRTPMEGEPTITEELARLRETPPEQAREDLTVSLRGPLPAELDRSDLPDRAAGLLEWVWAETVLPYWPRRRQLLQADVVARVGQLSQGGWAAALDDLRQGMRWLGEGRLRINTYDYPPREVTGTRLLFVPVTLDRGWVCWDTTQRFAVIYPCAGVLAEPDRAPAPDALGRLLGPARASVLLLLDTPKSTTQLVALTGQALGSVGRHLKVLLDARLVRRRRAGRSVLYYRTDTGETLVRAQNQPASNSSRAAGSSFIGKRFPLATTTWVAEATDRKSLDRVEHFDIGSTLGGVNYGVSPGDGYLAEPYAYVGPPEPRTGPFWNAPSAPPSRCASSLMRKRSWRSIGRGGA